MQEKSKEWTTRSVRAWNLKSGGVISFWDTRKKGEVLRTVDRVNASDEGPELVTIRFRRWKWAMQSKRNYIVRVRRLA